MREVCRRLTVLAAILSLLAGSWLPADTSAFADADGICGPVLAGDQSTARLNADQPAPHGQHCLFCHWRHTMASAATAAPAVIALPIEAGRAPAIPPSLDPTLIHTSAATPRGPPAVS